MHSIGQKWLLQKPKDYYLKQIRFYFTFHSSNECDTEDLSNGCWKLIFEIRNTLCFNI